MRNNSPKSNIYSKECISITETPAHPTKMKKNRRNKKNIPYFLPVVYIRMNKDRNMGVILEFRPNFCPVHLIDKVKECFAIKNK